MTDPATPDALPPADATASASDVGSEPAAAGSEPGAAGAEPVAAGAVAETNAVAETGPADATPAVETGADAVAETGAAPAVEAVRHRHPFYLRGRRLRLPASRRGLFALLLVLSAMGFVGIFAGVSLIRWTETADFCGRCHTMAPELQANQDGRHAEVTCGECHVEPGIVGWVKAKLNGTRQLVDVVLGTYPTPIPPPNHASLPGATDTCMTCHDVEGGGAITALKSYTQFKEDEANTREFVALLIRPGGGDPQNVDRSVHWHVVRTFTYNTPDENASTIDFVTSTTPDGQVQEWIALDKVSDAAHVQPDIDAIKATQPTVTLSCYDCHNRVGHTMANPGTDMDYELSVGTIDPSLPYIKREGMRILWGSYPDYASADAEIDKLRDFYATNYPLVAQTKAAQVDGAIEQIKRLYRLSANPDMKVTPATYPDNLGHKDFPGCFRCHDGGHFLVKDGAATHTMIPSTCDTCHTFPQIGPTIASLPLGEPPATHNDDLWVFDHKNVATNVDPGGQSCGQCHARDYCVNCHATGAVTVDHDVMATNHAKVIRDQGNTACAYCHQPAFCARCHAEPVLPVTTPSSDSPTTGALPDLPAGVSWPLTPRS